MKWVLITAPDEEIVTELDKPLKIGHYLSLTVWSEDPFKNFKEVEDRVERLEDKFKHTHKATEFGGDVCSICGWDIRDKIHTRVPV